MDPTSSYHNTHPLALDFMISQYIQWNLVQLPTLILSYTDD